MSLGTSLRMEYLPLLDMLYSLSLVEEVGHSLAHSFTHSLIHSLISPLAFTIKREEKHGGDISFMTYQELEDSYAKQEVYPLDLKNAVADELNIVCGGS